MSNRFHGLIAMVLLVIAAPSLAEPTPVTVRVIARDAKFIGTSMGGARVTLRDVRSGKRLAEGVTQGGTGDTDRIMHASGRSPLRSSEGAAAYAASLDIAQPTLVELTVEGPLGHPGSALRASQQRWIMPGEGMTQGEGWTIELPGLVITPQARISGVAAKISAKVELMCGCPITPGGLWDAADYEVKATLRQRGKVVGAAPLAFITAPGGFEGDLTLPGRGAYRLGIAAHNLKTGNSGYIELPIKAD
ncbi:hypothetical protein [Sphingobium nicotianae]|uniref:DUF4402 domain-containing protein n=1 Tax=Sphingobium nicotianae TaxID=2782607 RepID=A0A9X1ISR5_9SPHN|nr:hypothetical protein [Sphingobium nicotianae]MBT2188520.1 hypothetical protein [Sphingobium nicotianae]